MVTYAADHSWSSVYHQMHSVTGDVIALRRDLRNGIRHYFGDHQQCSFTLHDKNCLEN